MNAEPEVEPLAEVVSRLGITSTAVKVAANPNASGEWAKDATHWQVELSRGLYSQGARQGITTYYSMGSAHKGKPATAEVLTSLALDASGYDNAATFEDWCAEYGDNPDSRKAEACWRAVGENTRKLRLFLGDDYNAVLLAAQDA